MSFFNESFKKVFVGIQTSGSGAGQNPNPNLTDGFINTSGISTSSLYQTSSTASQNYGVGAWGLFDPKTYLSKTSAQVSGCCPLILASASIFNQDKIGPFHGGYQESVKSKKIVPKLVNRFVRVDKCTPQAQVTHIGTTKYTKSLSPVNSTCSFDFRCGETYYLYVEVKGAPATRFLNHQAYRIIEAYTGCCPTNQPTALVDSTLVMITWAKSIVNDPILQFFIQPVVYSEAGTAYGAPGNTLSLPSWDTYVSPGHVAGKTAGLRLQGSYFDTVFQDCTFYPTDYYNIEPVIMNFSMVDFNGDPCAFTGICVVDECKGVQVMGTGESAVRDLIMSESYRQNFFATDQDLRVREITLGNQFLSAINRQSLYTRYIIQHVVPNYNNPNITIDNDQYVLEVVTNNPNATFETMMNNWLSGCSDNCASLEVVSCTPCTILTP